MGKKLIIIVFAATLAGGYAMYGSQQGVMRADQELTDYQYEMLAREVALTGMNMAKQRVYQNEGYDGDMAGNWQEGQYNVLVSQSGDANNGGDGGGQGASANFNKKISPVLECVHDQGDGTFLASFGYYNRNPDNSLVNVGPANRFHHGMLGEDNGQPAIFLPGRQRNVFTVAFDGTSLIWNLTSVGSATATASRSSQRCNEVPAPPPSDEAPGISIRAVGSVDTPGGTIRHTIFARYEVTEDAAGSGINQTVPAFMKYALLSDRLTINGNNTIGAVVNPTINANVHSNGRITINGNNDIYGFATYSDQASLNPAIEIRDPFQPNDNPSGAAGLAQADPVEIPTFDPDHFINKADKVENGNLTFNGHKTIQLGTKDNPTIWYVPGNLTVNGQITMEGYGIFIVKGLININGRLTSNAPTCPNSHLAFYTERMVNLNGSSDIEGQFLAQENINFNGNINLIGNAVAGGTIVLNGSQTIEYRVAAPSLTAPFWESDEASESLKLVTQQEW